ncbi:hypothetical protein D770_09970 [Flammeovirgaceae bacterium 311]|nr:hypothetical protein D770_09970 [Flammeovirgaceae bacterium 311]
MEKNNLYFIALAAAEYYFQKSDQLTAALLKFSNGNLAMKIKKNILVYVTRHLNVGDDLYSKGLSISSDTKSIDFHLNFSSNLTAQGATNMKSDAQSLERDLEDSKRPKMIQVRLGSKQSFDAVVKSFTNFVDLYQLKKPVKVFVNITIVNTYRLPCVVESDSHDMITLSITE